MRPTFAFFLSLVVTTASAQHCSDFIKFNVDSIKQDTLYEFVNNVKLTNEKQSLSINAMAIGNDFAIILTFDDGTECVSLSDMIEFSFQDRPKVKFGNNGGGNCVGKEVVYFNLKDQLSDLNAFMGNKMASVNVIREQNSNVFEVDDEKSILLKNSISCAVRCLKTIPAKVSVSAFEDIPADDSNLVFTIVEAMPEFEGGHDAMTRYFTRTINPKAANYGKGTVYVQFIVNTDGSISETKTIRGVNPAMDKEAQRVVSKMPKWKPGMQSGKRVAVKFVLPIRF
jgi:TonB family protein